MSPVITGALIALGGAIFGALLGAGISVWVAKQQIAASSRQKRVDLLSAQLAEQRVIFQRISAIKTDLSDPGLSDDQIRSRLIDSFVSKASMFLTVAHMHPKPFEDKVIGLLAQINNFIAAAKLGQAIDEEEARDCVTQISPVEQEMLRLVRDRLRMMQGSLDNLMSTME